LGLGCLRREYLGKMNACPCKRAAPKDGPQSARRRRYFVMISGPMKVVGNHVDSHGI